MSPECSAHILVVDDDPKIRVLLRRCFEGEGFRVSEAGEAAQAMATLEGTPVDLVTLDLSLPGADGLSLAREIRARSQVPIVMVTGKGDTIDRVVGLEVGADDYIAKPFHLRELLARVRAVLRRTERPGAPLQAIPNGVHASEVAAAGPGVFAFDRFVLDVPKRELKAAGRTLVVLTTAEFTLLEVFVRHPKRVLTRDQIMDLLKGHAWSPLDRTIDNLVAKLRRKIEADPELPLLIKTVRGAGYTFAADVTGK